MRNRSSDIKIWTCFPTKYVFLLRISDMCVPFSKLLGKRIKMPNNSRCSHMCKLNNKFRRLLNVFLKLIKNDVLFKSWNINNKYVPQYIWPSTYKREKNLFMINLIKRAMEYNRKVRSVKKCGTRHYQLKYLKYGYLWNPSFSYSTKQLVLVSYYYLLFFCDGNDLLFIHFLLECD